MFAAAALGGCGDDEDPAQGTNAGGRPLIVDWRAGTYEGVQLGDTRRQLVKALGRPGARGRYGPDVPLGERSEEIGSLTNYGAPDIGRGIAPFETLRYRRRVFNTTGDRVTSWGTTDPRAQTPEGVGIGDERDLVKRRYPKADCFIQNEDSEYAEYPICRIRVCKGRTMSFGGDPIKSIYLAAESKAGLASCRRPAVIS
jgi:hypothetical protein